MEESTCKTVLKGCRSCANRVYDEVWGEYKCTVYEHRLYDYDRYTDCRAYQKKGEPSNGNNRNQG